jgi:hypothetical protein
VTAAALTGIVLRRRVIAVAALAVGIVGVIELDLCPVGRTQVTAAALAEVVFWRGLVSMAVLTVRVVRVIEADLRPIGRAQMAAAALTSIVIGGHAFSVTALAIVCREVIKPYLSKTNRVVAQLARCPHLSAVRILVAGHTLALRPLIDPLSMAALAFCCGVSAQQGKGMILQHVGRKGHSARRDRGAWHRSRIHRRRHL